MTGLQGPLNALCGVGRCLALTAGLLCSAQWTVAADRTAQALADVRPTASNVSSTPWAELKAEQKAALAPLQRDWAAIDGVRQQKWLELATRMPAMPAEERARIKQRMAQWASLTPAKRNQVRLQFLEAKQLPSEQRQARWQEYQALSEDEKLALARQASPAPLAGDKPGQRVAARVEAKPGAGKLNVVQAPPPPATKSATSTALQAKPGATTRPLTTPATPPLHHQTGLPKIVATENFVDPATMLPKRGPQGAAVRSALTEKPAATP